MTKTQLLIVEDDQALARMLCSVLELRGYRVVMALDRDSALLALQANPQLRCVIQDLGLPPMPNSLEAGLETMREILKLSPSVKIIVLTGRGKQEAALQAIKEGAFDFFEKPVAVDMLVNAIERSLLFANAEQTMQGEGLYPIHFNSSLEEDGLKATKDSFEAQLVRRVLVEAEYNVKTASERLGLRRENLYYLIRKHGIELDRAGDFAEV